jgi:hypothetical protein
MHVLRAADYPLPPSIDALFDRAELLVMELDLDDVDAAAQQATVMAAATLAPGTGLRDLVRPDVYRLTEQRALELGIDMALLEGFEPWFLAVTLLDVGMRRIGFEAERGLEQYFVGKARAAGKEIVGLETFAMQIGIFDALAASAQQAMLEQTLGELDEAEQAMTDMVGAWRDGRLDELSEELLDEFAEFPGLYETLVTDRNAAWVAALEDMLDEGKRYLVVVGALHLVGRDNVVAMLDARGYDVTLLE